MEIHRMEMTGIKNPPIQTQGRQAKLHGEFHNPRTQSPTIPKKTVEMASTPYKITVKAVPEKSQVETQIKMCLRLEDKTGATIRTWPSVRLDPLLVAPPATRRKLNTQKQKQQKNLAQSTTNQPLLLKAEVVAATPPNHVIQRCYGCIQQASNEK